MTTAADAQGQIAVPSDMDVVADPKDGSEYPSSTRGCVNNQQVAAVCQQNRQNRRGEATCTSSIVDPLHISYLIFGGWQTATLQQTLQVFECQLNAHHAANKQPTAQRHCYLFGASVSLADVVLFVGLHRLVLLSNYNGFVLPSR